MMTSCFFSSAMAILLEFSFEGRLSATHGNDHGEAA
jgi:hypothetical protein